MPEWTYLFFDTKVSLPLSIVLRGFKKKNPKSNNQKEIQRMWITKTLEERLKEILRDDNSIKRGTVLIDLLIECNNWKYYNGNYKNKKSKTIPSTHP